MFKWLQLSIKVQKSLLHLMDVPLPATLPELEKPSVEFYFERKGTACSPTQLNRVCVFGFLVFLRFSFGFFSWERFRFSRPGRRPCSLHGAATKQEDAGVLRCQNPFPPHHDEPVSAVHPNAPEQYQQWVKICSSRNASLIWHLTVVFCPSALWNGRSAVWTSWTRAGKMHTGSAAEDWGVQPSKNC